MKALSSQQQVRLDNLVLAIDVRAETIRETVERINQANRQLRAELHSAIANYNGAIAALGKFLEGLSRAAFETFSDRSEGWRNSEVGTAYLEWADNLLEASESVVGIDFTSEELETPELFDPDAWTRPPIAPEEA